MIGERASLTHRRLLAGSELLTEGRGASTGENSAVTRYGVLHLMQLERARFTSGPDEHAQEAKARQRLL